MSIPVARVQEKGQVTIPLEMRRKLNLKKGDLVVFMEMDEAIVISPAELTVSKALDIIGRRLGNKGIGLEQLMKQSGRIRAKLVEEEYGIANPDVA